MDGFAAVSLAQDFDGIGDFVLLAFELVAGVADGTADIAELLKLKDLIADAAEHGDDGKGLLRVELAAENGLGKAGGGELKADFGELGRVVVEEVDEGILVKAGLDEECLVEAPLAVAAAGGPIGDIAGSNFEAALGKGVGDFVVGDGVSEHAADHVALNFGQASDSAVASFGFGGAVLGGLRVGQESQGGRLGSGAGWLSIHKSFCFRGEPSAEAKILVTMGYYGLLWVTTSDRRRLEFDWNDRAEVSGRGGEGLATVVAAAAGAADAQLEDVHTTSEPVVGPGPRLPTPALKR